MAWNKGAVVIVKHGDEDMANAIEGGLNVKKISVGQSEELEQLKKENEDLKRDKELSKIHDDNNTDALIADLDANYGYNWTPPKWMEPIRSAFALVIYGITLFVNKYLIIK